LCSLHYQHNVSFPPNAAATAFDLFLPLRTGSFLPIAAIRSGSKFNHMDDLVFPPELDDDDVYWRTIPRWAYWLGIFAVAFVAYALIHWV
jgi:hypothetical protein